MRKNSLSNCEKYFMSLQLCYSLGWNLNKKLKHRRINSIQIAYIFLILSKKLTLN